METKKLTVLIVSQFTQLQCLITVELRTCITFSADLLCCIWKATSELTGPMVVEDVVYENADGDQGSMPEKIFRRLIFGRSSGLVQSEALLIRDPHSDETDKKNKNVSASSKKRRSKKGLFLFWLLAIPIAFIVTS